MNEVPYQPPSDRLILSHSQLIIRGKPTKKLAESLRRERFFGFPCHKRPTIVQLRLEVNVLLVVSLQYKSRPVVRLRPLLLAHHLELGAAQSRTLAFTLLHS